MENIKVLRLLSGEDLIAKVSSLSIDGPLIIIYSPLQIVMTQMNQQGGMQFSFLPWPMFADRDEMKTTGLKLDRNYVPVLYDPDAKFIAQYNKIVMGESGLIIPNSAKGIVLQ